jgi:SAM-dependent methyltransferase
MTGKEQLTTAADWRWRNYHPMSLRKALRKAKNQNGWISKAKSFYRPTDKTFLELGCAPGRLSLLLAYRGSEVSEPESPGIPPNLKCFGVDYSDSAETYLHTMRALPDTDATLYREDVFTFHPGRQFDIVVSGRRKVISYASLRWTKTGRRN